MLTWAIYWRLRQKGIIVPGIKCTAAVESLRITEIILRQKELMDEMNALDKEIKSHIESEYYTGQLYDANPNCKHVLDENHWDGIRCTKCPGWYCA